MTTTINGFENHQLTVEVDTEHFRAYRVHDPKLGRMQSWRLFFTPEGITICGDMVGPNPNAFQSSPGYAEGWLAGTTSFHYLCSKFFWKEWIPATAYAWVKDLLEGDNLEDYLENYIDNKGLHPRVRQEIENRLKYDDPDCPSAEFATGYGFGEWYGRTFEADPCECYSHGTGYPEGERLEKLRTVWSQLWYQHQEKKVQDGILEEVTT